MIDIRPRMETPSLFKRSTWRKPDKKRGRLKKIVNVLFPFLQYEPKGRYFPFLKCYSMLIILFLNSSLFYFYFFLHFSIIRKNLLFFSVLMLIHFFSFHNKNIIFKVVFFPSSCSVCYVLFSVALTKLWLIWLSGF